MVPATSDRRAAQEARPLRQLEPLALGMSDGGGERSWASPRGHSRGRTASSRSAERKDFELYESVMKVAELRRAGTPEEGNEVVADRPRDTRCGRRCQR